MELQRRHLGLGPRPLRGAAAADRAEAVNALMKPRFGFTVEQANHVLDMPVGSQTQDAQEELAAERQAVRTLAPRRFRCDPVAWERRRR